MALLNGPPRVEYTLNELGVTLGGACCGVWIWASENLAQVEEVRSTFDRPGWTPTRAKAGAAKVAYA